ncbi:MAG: SsgA family sporulation/cell division regulator [Frankia sp.]
MNSDSTPITSPLTVRIVQEGVARDEIPATLDYDPTDPYAVTISFHVGLDRNAGDTVSWTIGRQLLRDGLAGLAGDADVQVWPGNEAEADRAEKLALYLSLSSNAGSAMFRMMRRDIASFLRHTDCIVAPGTESAHLDLDAELALLTQSSQS